MVRARRTAADAVAAALPGAVIAAEAEDWSAQAAGIALPMAALTDATGERSLPLALGIDLPAYVARAEAKGDAGEVVTVPVVGHPTARTIFVVGYGEGRPADFRKSAAALARAAADCPRVAAQLPADAGELELRAFVESFLLSSYTFTRRAEPRPRTLTELVVAGPPRDRVASAIERAVSAARAVATARDLANTPSSEKSPAWLAAAAERIAAGAGIPVTVRSEPQLLAEGFGGILAVGMGSVHSPRLIELRYDPPGARRHVVLIGKGITFDSGGLSIKPNDGMVSMKTDMAGGAAVIAAIGAAAELGLGVRVTALVPAAENMPSGAAQRPGDVIVQYGGRTVEVLNTDAEGRLVLADALSYADASLDPDVVIDVATLTGAASLALGRRVGALFANDDALADALVAAAQAGGEMLWRMPLVDEYRVALDSPVADLRNVGDPERQLSGGAITAALFLREFAGQRRWAHLDIAGPARSDRVDDDLTKGATGLATRTLLRFLEATAKRR